MAEKQELENNNLTEFNSGLFTDTSPLHQPKGSQRFALNVVNAHSIEGNQKQAGYNTTKTTEESNEIYTTLTTGFIPIGQVYIGDDEIVIFSVTEDNTNSEIGILDGLGHYTSLVREPELCFQLQHQIQAIYRLRRGCEKTIYWTDGINPVRFYIIEKEEDFKTTQDNWDVSKFDLFKRFKKVPVFKENDFKVKEEGNLKAGSYNFAIQYLDNDLNPSEWISTSKTINIYNDKLGNNYSQIRGSTNKETFYQQFGITSKSIDLIVDNLDESFPFYRIAVIEATIGIGKVNKVTVSPHISTSVKTYKVTGAEVSEIVVEEILQEVNIIQTAESILQIENRLLLGNTTGKQINYCELQKYANQIKSACVVKPVELFDINHPTNSKNPITQDRGYMPGEIYSFGIVYTFEDGTTSPVYHIPGMEDYTDVTLPEGSYRMNTTNNKLSATYTDNSNCGDTSYWGDLKNKEIRHHRFPKRSEIENLGLLNKLEYTPSSQATRLNVVLKSDSQYTFLNLSGSEFTIQLKKTIYPNGAADIGMAYGAVYEETGVISALALFGAWNENLNFNVNDKLISITMNNIVIPLSNVTVSSIVMNAFNDGTNSSKIVLSRDIAADIAHVYSTLGPDYNQFDIFTFAKNVITTSEDFGAPYLFKIFEHFSIALLDNPGVNPILTPINKTLFSVDIDNTILPENISISFSDSNLANSLGVEFILEAESYTKVFDVPDSSSSILGIKFFDINIPANYGINGYYIVRNERTEIDKTILDTGILLPMTEHEKFISFGNILPSKKGSFDNKLRKDTYALLHLKNNFENIEYKGDVKFSLEGYYDLGAPKTSASWIEDALVGTSYDPEYHSKDEADKDGLTLYTFTKFSDSGEYKTQRQDDIFGAGNVNEILYLKPLTSKNVQIGTQNKEIFNISSDNSISIVRLNNEVDIFEEKDTLEEYIEPIIKSEEFGNIDKIVKRPDTVKNLTKYPYVIISRNITNSYLNFRYLPYYKEHTNRNEATQTSIEIFNGDIHISSITYNTSMQYNIQAPRRKTKTTLWKYILGGVLIVMGVVGAVFTGGAAGVLAGIGVGLIATSLALTSIISGIEQDKLNEVYNKKYEEGLRDTIEDYTTTQNLKNIKFKDDTIIWCNYVLANLYFETEVNTALRQGNTKGLPDFINTPTVYNEEEMNFRAINKLSVFDPDQKNGRLYQGFATPEFYEINKDFYRTNKEKAYFALGLEYDCCSDCTEIFPHRIHYSQQSFQEELTDNYRTFLPNNYRDIDGETGEITNLFKIQDSLFVHTEEGLWNLPQNIKRRQVDEVVSYIGTGSYFENPPKKIIEGNNGMSAGLKHRESVLQCEHGYFFVCESQKKILQFTGANLVPISDIGMIKWFRDNIGQSKKGDNPSNPNSSGFISSYDSFNNRILFTKKDKNGINDISWTLSFDLISRKWISFHSYLPNMYFYTPNKLYSWIYGNNNIWKHNVKGKYQSFYGKKYPFIIEYVSLSSPLQTKVFDAIQLICNAEKYDTLLNEFVDVDNVFFNKLIAYNSRQCTGELNIRIKQKNQTPWCAITESLSEITASKNERVWSLNTLRDIRTDYDKPIFDSNPSNPVIQQNYYIDKILNTNSMSFQKNWNELENLRDKYLQVRLIFDNLDEAKLSLDFSSENEKISIR